MNTNQGLAIGTWILPSGNTCDAVLTTDGGGHLHILFAWGDPPPLSPADESFYLRIIIPEVTQRALGPMEGANVPR